MKQNSLSAALKVLGLSQKKPLTSFVGTGKETQAMIANLARHTSHADIFVRDVASLCFNLLYLMKFLDPVI